MNQAEVTPTPRMTMTLQRLWRILGAVWLGMTLFALYLVVYWFGVAMVCDACPDEIAMAGFGGAWVLVVSAVASAAAILGRSSSARPLATIASLVALGHAQIILLMGRAVRLMSVEYVQGAILLLVGTLSLVAALWMSFGRSGRSAFDACVAGVVHKREGERAMLQSSGAVARHMTPAYMWVTTGLAALALVLALFSAVRVENLRSEMIAVGRGRPAPGVAGGQGQDIRQEVAAIGLRVTVVEDTVHDLSAALSELRSEVQRLSR